jgi:hypothetical protein
VSNFTSGWHDQTLFFCWRKHCALPVFGGWEIWMVFARRVRLNTGKSDVRGRDITTVPGYLTANGSANKSRGTTSEARVALRKLCIGMFVFYSRCCFRFASWRSQARMRGGPGSVA